MSLALLVRKTDVLTVSIANAASLSGEIDVRQYALMGIIMPSAWTTATLTFQGSDKSGGTFVNLYDDVATEIEVQAAASRGVGVDSFAAALAAFPWIKIRSGTSGTPVNQAAARTLLLVVKS